MFILYLLMHLQSKQLKNGVDVIIDQLKGTNTVSVRVYVKNTGSVYEDQYYGAGISHYLEHLISGGTTEKRTEKEYQNILQSMGGYVNAYTTYDHTCYYINGSSKYTEDFIKIIYEWINLAKLEPFEVNREKGVIINEILMREKNPSTRMWRKFIKKLFKNHPFLYPIIGYEPVFKKLKREDVYNFYKERYIPQNLVVAIGGDIDIKRTEKLVDSLFGSITPKIEKIVSVPEIYPQYKGMQEYDEEEKGITSNKLYIGFITVPDGNKDSYPLDMFSYIINKHLKEILKDKRKLVSNVYCYHSTFNFGIGYMGIVADIISEDSMDVVKDEILKIILKPEKYISSKEIKVKKRELFFSQYKEENVQNHISRIARDYVVNGDMQYSRHWVENMQKVDKKDILNTVKKYIVPENCTIVKFHKNIEEVEQKKKKHVETVDRVKLKNGAVLLLHKNEDSPVFIIKIAFKGGLYHGGLPLLAALNMVNKSTKHFNKYRLQDFLDNNGIEYYTDIDELASYITIKGYKKNINKAIKLLNDVIYYPQFTKENLKEYKEDFLTGIRKSHERSTSIARRIFYRTFWNKTPMSALYPDSSNIEQLNLKDIKDLYKKYITNNSDVTIAVYGNINKNYVKDKIEKLLEKTDRREIKIDRKLTYLQDTTIEYKYRHPQVNIFIAYKTTYAYSKDYYALRIISELFSSFNGRLHNALRGERSLVYYGYGYIYTNYCESPFIFNSQTTLENYKKVIEVINNEVEKLKNGDITEEEIENIKKEMFNRMDTWYQTESDKASRDIKLILMGKELEFIPEKYKENLKKVTKEDIIRVARKYFKKPYILITRPENE